MFHKFLINNMSFPLVWGIKFRYRGFVTFLVREGFKKKSDNYHFWGGGGAARVIYHFFFGLKMIFKQF